jgi:hypothetical protein
MASKKGKGCIFGCLGLLLVGGGVVIATGIAGAGAWYWMGGSDAGLMDFGNDADELSALFDESLEALEAAELAAQEAADGVAVVEPPALEEPVEDDGVRDALEEALAMEAAPPPPPAPEPEPVPAPAPSSGSSASSGSDGGSAAPAPAPAPAPKPSPAPASGGGGGHSVAITGNAKVVLVSGGARYNMPGRVPTGSYDIEATFPGEPAVVVGTIKVNGASSINCSDRMGTCRVR